MTAPTETPSLTTEQARFLAFWWAAWRAYSDAPRAHLMPPARTLHSAEREQLFAWVRARMAVWLDGAEDVGLSAPAYFDMFPEARPELAGVISAALGLDHEGPDEETPAWALCEAAGWPS